jgi:serine/threonine protein kinase
MTPERWVKIRDIFESIMDADADRRAAVLETACGGDESLKAEVQAMFDAGNSAGHMNGPVSAAAAVRQQVLAADPLEGRVIGHYKILRRVGTGGMASVYAAARVDQEFHKIVAVKLVKPGMDSEEILRRFRTERQVLAGLEHPNIARLLDGGTTEQGIPYLVMEYVDGLPIDVYCDTHNLSLNERLELFQCVCEAVQYAHQNLVVHRDLKPSNILVNESGVPKLLDFGIAKLLRPEHAGQQAHLTQTHVRPMTPEYASPEQVRGDPINTASDVYSLGVLLYRLLSGHSPYRLKSAASTEIEQAICGVEPERPSVAITRLGAVPKIKAEKVRRQLRGDLDVIVMTALRKEPQRRYASVERFSEDIRRHLEGLPVTARKDTWTYRVSKFSTRHKAGVAIAALIALVLIASSAVSLYYLRQARIQKSVTLQLASFMVLDFDSAMQSGVTPARKAFLAAVVGHLNQLAPDSANDSSTRRLLVKAYMKVGDLQGNLYGPNLGESAAARKSYETALALARQEARSDPRNESVQRDVALSRERLGDLASLGGDRREALEQYRSAENVYRKFLDANPSRLDALKDLRRVLYTTGITQYELGDPARALETYHRELETAQRAATLSGNTPEARRIVAVAEEHVGDMLARNGTNIEAIVNLRRGESVYGDLLKADPNSVQLQQDAGAVGVILGDALAAAGRSDDAEQAYRRSLVLLDSLLNSDPHNQHYQRTLDGTLGRLSAVLLQLGKKAAARETSKRAIKILEALVHQLDPAVHDMHEYCWFLLTTPFADLHDPPAALYFARKAVEKTNGSVPAILDVLARALAENGDYGAAVETERKVVALSSGAGSTDRAEFEANLARFETALKHQ